MISAVIKTGYDNKPRVLANTSFLLPFWAAFAALSLNWCILNKRLIFTWFSRIQDNSQWYAFYIIRRFHNIKTSDCMNRTVWSSGWIPQARSEVNVLLSYNSN